MGNVTDLDLVRLAQAIYQGPQAVAWGHYEAPPSDDGICWGFRELNGFAILVFRGSASFQDWWRDGISAIAIQDPDLGPLPLGFAEGLDGAINAMLPLAANLPILVVGHSLGAARAVIAAAKLAQRGLTVAGVVAFGCPRPGQQKLWDVLRAHGITVRVYQNQSDLVTDAPFSPFLPPPSPIRLAVMPQPNDTFDVFAAHHIWEYSQGVMDLLAIPSFVL